MSPPNPSRPPFPPSIPQVRAIFCRSKPAPEPTPDPEVLLLEAMAKGDRLFQQKLNIYLDMASRVSQEMEDLYTDEFKAAQDAFLASLELNKYWIQVGAPV